MSDIVTIALIFFGFLFLSFVVILIKFPEIVSRKIAGTSGLEITKDSVKITFAVESARKSYEQKNVDVPSQSAIKTQLDPLVGRHRILWVDDNPSNNQFEMETLLGLGYQVDIALNNDHAKRLASTFGYDLILSDIGRRSPEAPQAGLQLPDFLKKSISSLPSLIYYTGDAVKAETLTSYPVTDQPGALFQAISQALKK